MKKYNGKYSLTENLIKGRGMGLLKESNLAWQGDFTEIIAGATVVKGSPVTSDADVLANLPAGATAQIYNAAKAAGTAQKADLKTLFSQGAAMGQTALTLGTNAGGIQGCKWGGRSGRGSTTGDIELQLTSGTSLQVSLKSSQKGSVSTNMAFQGNFGFKSLMPTIYQNIQTKMKAEIAAAYTAAGVTQPSSGYGETDPARNPDGAKGAAAANEARENAHDVGAQEAQAQMTAANIKSLLQKMINNATGVIVVGPNGVVPGATSGIAQALGNPSANLTATQSGKGLDIKDGATLVARFQGPRFATKDTNSPRIDIQPR